MAKNSIRDFSATAGSNTDIQSVNIDENCPASGINNAIRELMVDLKNVSTGAVNLETPGADQLNVDNIRIDGNTISSTDTNGDITLDPAGTGVVAITGVITANGHTSSAPSVFEASGNGDQVGVQLKVKANNGSTSTQGLYGNAGSTNAGNTIVLGNSGSSGLLVDSSGDVGIGAAPSVPFEVKKENAGFQAILDNDNGSAKGLKVRIKANDSGDFPVFQAVSASSGSDVEVFTILDDGTVGIGTSSPGVKLEVNGDIKTNVASSSNAQISAVTAGSSNYATFTTTNGARSYSMQVRPDVSNSFVIRDETGGANKFVILTTGEVVINDTARTLACVQHISFDGANEQGLCIKNTANNSSGAAIRFIDHAGGNSGGGIYFADSNSITYATSSDARLKENVADMTGAIDRVKALAPKRFNFISSPDTTIDGFLAHEAQVVVPEAVIGTENAVDDDDNPVYQAMDAGRLVPLLTGALKEAIAKIETLETEMTALKARVTALEA